MTFLQLLYKVEALSSLTKKYSKTLYVDERIYNTTTLFSLNIQNTQSRLNPGVRCYLSKSQRSSIRTKKLFLIGFKL